MFITWISQLVALLDKEEGAAIHDILISLARDYPQALYYPMKISSCNFKFGSDAVGRANQEALSEYGKIIFTAVEH
jgi:DNA-dependent protein kinase catalytic subunit